ncbi:hypothetical protein C2E23DRAFT_818147 [Lenzites betulinus]|nr:hypothetical protein C2E23DRAFT_818147 [Lenzites betulinus]
MTASLRTWSLWHCGAAARAQAGLGPRPRTYTVRGVAAGELCVVRRGVGPLGRAGPAGWRFRGREPVGNVAVRLAGVHASALRL